MKTYIYDQREESTGVELRKLTEEDAFMYEDKLHLVVNIEEQYECFCFEDGYIVWLPRELKVTPVSIDIYIRRDRPLSDFKD